MTKKHWAWLMIAFGLALIWGHSKFTAGTIDSTTTMGKLAGDLASWSVLNSSTATGATPPYLAYGLLAVGAWLLFGHKVAAAV